MAYDEGLAQRVREVLTSSPGFSEKKMFGGVGFMLQGNIACGVFKHELMVRVGPEGYSEALKRPYVRLFDMVGRPMKGWVAVGQQGLASHEDLQNWVGLGTQYALSLPAK